MVVVVVVIVVEIAVVVTDVIVVVFVVVLLADMFENIINGTRFGGDSHIPMLTVRRCRSRRDAARAAAAGARIASYYILLYVSIQLKESITNGAEVYRSTFEGYIYM